MSKLRILALCALLMGCATVSYEEPQSGERARVRFALDPSVTDVTVVRSYTDQECNGEREWMRLYNGFLVAGDSRRLGIPLDKFHRNGAQEFFVPAGDRLFLMFHGSSTVGNWTYSCAVPVAFEVGASQDYELMMSMGPTSGNSCHVILSEIIADGGEPRRQQLNAFENIASEGCQTAFRRFRWG